MQRPARTRPDEMHPSRPARARAVAPECRFRIAHHAHARTVGPAPGHRTPHRCRRFRNSRCRAAVRVRLRHPASARGDRAPHARAATSQDSQPARRRATMRAHRRAARVRSSAGRTSAAVREARHRWRRRAPCRDRAETETRALGCVRSCRRCPRTSRVQVRRGPPARRGGRAPAARAPRTRRSCRRRGPGRRRSSLQKLRRPTENTPCLSTCSLYVRMASRFCRSHRSRRCRDDRSSRRFPVVLLTRLH